ncbi:hypothetical protein [Phyllobacterium sp. UNC302MFCol5.2]|uniref:hypothetical protein n=1 Tax=Phyllobacterium sp. UNC302MFCol5.2 TaxID=1449065 RepID=UPI0004883606|nr:hypothetical protein [Phyllobacterium sp. UNC302MFCol5.2]
MAPFRTMLIVLALAPLVGQPARAEESPGYTLEKTADGFVRMNNKTGEMSICQQQAAQLVCKVAAEERTAYEEDIADLKGRVAKLEDTVAAMGKIPPIVRDALPSDEQFEKSLGYMEKFMRRFMGIAKEFGYSPEDNKPAPDTLEKT